MKALLLLLLLAPALHAAEPPAPKPAAVKKKKKTLPMLPDTPMLQPEIVNPFKQNFSSGPTTSDRLEKINEQRPPQGGGKTMTDASLQKSAVGPGWTLVPLPAFVYNRNEGAWVGALAPIFRANPKGEVEDIFAPLYLHNAKIGETFTFNYFGYRKNTTQYQLVLSHATKVERVVDLRYRNIAFGENGRYILAFTGNTSKSAFNRFFGFDERTGGHRESIYTMGDSNIKLAGGVNLAHQYALTFQERYRDVAIENGVTDSIPQSLVLFRGVPGMRGASIWGQSVEFKHDSRDNTMTPLRGDLVTLTVEHSRDFQTSQHVNWWRFTAEGRGYFPHYDDKAVLVLHGMLDAVLGDVRRTVPFFERPTLGGETTLRAFGKGRFYSNSAVLFNIEERFSFLRRAIMGNLVELEVAPFLDIGRAARTPASNGTVRFMQFNPGIGVRALARPNIAARMDLAWGRDGVNAYVGLDYPF